MNVFKTKDSEKLLEYEIKDIEKLLADWCVFYYESGCYEGNGFAVWKKNDKFFYHDMGHCSCYGPTEEMKNVGGYKSLEDVKMFANKYNHGSEVIMLIEELSKENKINI